jgi:hypothetical protein
MDNRLVDQILASVTEGPGSVDIREHLPVLKEYASKCDHVTEFGVRWVVSTWAFMAGSPKTLESFDVMDFRSWGIDPVVLDNAASEAGVEFKFWHDNVLVTDKVKETDLLFIDTIHSYKQLKMELHLHASKVRKYIAFHDTVSFGDIDEAEIYDTGLWSESLSDYFRGLSSNKKGIMPAIEEFLAEHPEEWEIEKAFRNNNGLMILKRKQ